MQLETGKDALIDLKQSLSKGNYIVSYLVIVSSNLNHNEACLSRHSS